LLDACPAGAISAVSESNPMPPARLASVIVTAVCAALTVLCVDRALTWRFPPHIQTEVEEGVSWLKTHDPTVLAIGSSHGRTFEVLDRQLDQRTAGHERCAAIAVEFGKLTSYLWVLEHRLLPVLDERANGRGNLRHLLLVTQWWDSVVSNGGRRGADGAQEQLNLPSRAWQMRDFLADAARNGLDDYNRNWMQTRFIRMCGDSLLVRDRGHARIWGLLQGRNPDVLAPAAYESRVQDWRRMITRSAPNLCDPHELAAMRRIVEIARARGLDVTILLYPLKPATVDEQGLGTTLRPFSARIQKECAELGVRFIDCTTGSPLTDADYAYDFDHVLPRGNETWCRWALDGVLAFLLPGAQPR
jgi:hypothetical protein